MVQIMERCGERQRNLEKTSERAVEVVRLEATARCEGADLDRPAEEIANLAKKAGDQGAVGLDMRVCPKCGDTLHPLGFTHHVKKCNGTRRKCNIPIRSKVCSVCGISMNRESIPRHETMCRARRDALNSPAPWHVEVANRAEPMAARTKKKQKRGDTMAKKRHGAREKRGELLLTDGPSDANIVATASQRRSTSIRVKRPHGLSGPKE